MRKSLALGIFLVYFQIAHAGEIQPSRQLAQAGVPLTPAQATQHEGETVTIEFQVKSVGWNQAGFDELYSEQTWQNPNAFFIRLPFSMRPQYNNSATNYFGGKVVRVTGKVETLNFGAMLRKVINVASMSQIEIIAAGAQRSAAPAPQPQVAQAPEPAPQPPAPPKKINFVGTWTLWGIPYTGGTIVYGTATISRNNTYKYNGAKGDYRVSNNVLTFTSGPLAPNTVEAVHNGECCQMVWQGKNYQNWIMSPK